MADVVERSPSKHMALSSTPGIALKVAVLGHDPAHVSPINTFTKTKKDDDLFPILPPVMDFTIPVLSHLLPSHFSNQK